MNTIPLDPRRQKDLVDFLKTLHQQHVRFALIGGWAVIAQTKVMRLTKDVDVYVAADDANLQRAVRALGVFGGPANLCSVEALRPEPGESFSGVHFGLAPNRVDLMTHMAIPFEEIASNSEPFDLDGVEVFVASIDDLIRLKQIAGRKQDKADIKVLEKERDRRTLAQRFPTLRGRPEKNPIKIGQHPDLYRADRSANAQHHAQGIGYVAESDVIVDWQDCTPAELRKAAEHGDITNDEYNEILAAEEQCEADHDADAIIDDGVNLELADVLLRGGFHAALLELDEKHMEESAQPFIDYVRERVVGDLEDKYQPGGSDYNDTVDRFQTDLENIGYGCLEKAAREVSDLCTQMIDDGTLNNVALEPVLHDPGNYDVLFNEDTYRANDGQVWSEQCGMHYEQFEGTEHSDDELEAILEGGEYDFSGYGSRRDAYEAGERDEAVLAGLRGQIPHRATYYGMSEEAFTYARKQLENNEPYISIESRKKDLTKKDFVSSWDVSASKHESDHMIAVVNQGRLDAAILALDPVAAQIGPEYDDVVHTFDGTNKSIAGVESEGCYVAKLKVKDLRAESAALGHCIGNPVNGHPQLLEAGDTQVYSIRLADGKPKFTIEIMKSTGARYEGFPTEIGGVSAGGMGPSARGVSPWTWHVAECKGKANRKPGFAAEADGVPRSPTSRMNKPGDVRMVCEFLLGLGFSPGQIEDCADIAPGVAAMVEAGVNPFVPPPAKKVRPHRDPRVQKPAENPRLNPVEGPFPVSAHVARLLRAAKPMGTVRGVR